MQFTQIVWRVRVVPLVLVGRLSHVEFFTLKSPPEIKQWLKLRTWQWNRTKIALGRQYYYSSISYGPLTIECGYSTYYHKNAKSKRGISLFVILEKSVDALRDRLAYFFSPEKSIDPSVFKYGGFMGRCIVSPLSNFFHLCNSGA